MNKCKIILIAFFLTIIAGVLFISKPVKAMIPPPASKPWLFLLGPKPSSNAVTVTVTWMEGAREEKVELKTFFKNYR